MPDENIAQPKHMLRWFHPTPGRLLIVLLAVEGILLLSERFRWFPFNEKKGWTVVIATAAVGVFLLIMLFWFIFSLIFRRHFQFSIWSLLVLTVAVAIPFSWLAVRMKAARDQKEAVDFFRTIHGTVNYDNAYDASMFDPITGISPPGPAWLRNVLGDHFFITVNLINLMGSKVTDTDMKRLEPLQELESLTLARTRVTDSVMEHVRGLRKLRLLDLGYTQITDVGLQQIQNLNQLQHLYLSNTKTTDAGLTFIRGMKSLQCIELQFTPIRDAGLENLKGLKHLERLVLLSTSITDAGMKHLMELKELKKLYLDETKVTDAGVAKLQKALPNCKIER